MDPYWTVLVFTEAHFESFVNQRTVTEWSNNANIQLILEMRTYGWLRNRKSKSLYRDTTCYLRQWNPLHCLSWDLSNGRNFSGSQWKDCYLLRIREEIRDEIQFVRESAKQRSRSIPFHIEDEGSLLILIYSCDGFLNPFHCVCPCVSLRDRNFLLGPFLQANLPRNRDEARTRRMNNVMCLMRSIPWLTDSHISSWALK